MSEPTLFCGNLSPKVTDEILYELFLQAGPIERVSIPKDKDGKSRLFGFVTFKHDVSVPYAIELMSDEKLFGRQLQVKARSQGRNTDAPNLYIPGSSTQSTPRQQQDQRRNDQYDRRDNHHHRNGGTSGDRRGHHSNDDDNSRRRSVDSQPYRSRQAYGGAGSASMPGTPTTVFNSHPMLSTHYTQHHQQRLLGGQSPLLINPVLEERLRFMQQQQVVQHGYGSRGQSQSHWHHHERRY